jgi:hypothetical protein
MQNRLIVEVRGEVIIITKQGTSFSATYGKERGSPNICLLAATIDHNASRKVAYEFRADAFEAALRKARELG